MNDITKTPADLAAYLNVIFQEEVLLDRQKTILYELKNHKPGRQWMELPSKINPEDLRGNGFFIFFIYLFLPAGGIGLVVGIVLGAIIETISSNGNALYLTIALCIIIAEVIVLMFSVYMGNYIAEDNNKKIAKNREEIRQAVLENEHLEAEYQAKLATWNDAISHVEHRIQEIEKVLALIYSDHVIYVKYQNIVAISAFKEYIDSGRARTLLEAYDKFELEYRLDTMQSTLNKIDNKLDMILDKMDKMTYELSNAIRENSEDSKRFNAEIVQYMDRVVENQQDQQKNLALIQNDQKCIAENTKVLGYIKNTQKRDFDMAPFIKMYNEKMY